MKCPRWFMREMNSFSLTCVSHYKSCTRMREDVQNHCSALEQNMGIEDVVKQSKDNKENILMKNCPDKLKQDNGEDGQCVKLKKSCETFRNKLPLLKVLMYSIKIADRKQNHYRLTSRGNVTTYIKLVRRDDLDIESSVRHGLAFDLMSLVMELYLEAKDICDHFIEECAFENDCPKFGDPCKEIREHCKTFVLPKAVSPTETSVSTIMATELVIVKDGKPKSTITMIDGTCVKANSKTTWVTSKSVPTKIHTSLTTSTQQCRPVPCTTEEIRTKGQKTAGADMEVPSRGTKISSLIVMNIVIWVIGIFVMI
ncbi:hypothetical protein PMAC_003418 [Pneumocystis sp. 'macacae']|nr:hypothetical protein PMAC_003418 [Pneumocystis sp. 'macacae']